MARPGRDVALARRAAGLRPVPLATTLGQDARYIRRIERAVLHPGSTADADALIALLPTLPDRAKFLLRSGTDRSRGPNTALYFPTGTADRPSTPHAPGQVIVDGDFRAKVALNNWADGSTFQAFISKRDGVADAWQFRVNPDGTLALLIFSGATNVGTQTTLPLGFAPGSWHVLRATYVADNGAAGRTVAFFSSPDEGATWVPLAGGGAVAGVKAIDASVAPITIGAGSLGFQAMTGQVAWAEARNGVNGPRIARFDANRVFPTGPRVPTSFPVEPGNLFTAHEFGGESSLPALYAGESATGTTTWDNTTGYEGTSSVLLTAATPSGGRASFDVHPAGPPVGYFPVIAGQTYTFVCHCKGVGSIHPFNGKINWSSNTTFLASLGGTTPNNSLAAWTSHAVTGIAPPGATRAAPGCDIRSAITGDQANFDGFAFYLGTELESRPPGDVWTMNGTGWAWVEAA